jgi:hypothetical protein
MTAPWSPNKPYTAGQLVMSGGNAYMCSTGGTSSAGNAPTGTGTGITDTAVVWACVTTTAWQATTAYSVGQLVTNAGNTYECTTAGTSAASGGPMATTATGIPDGNAYWACVTSATWLVNAATATAWQANHSYTLNDVVTNAGNTYYCTTAGKSANAASGGPTGTGSGIVDALTWAYTDLVGNATDNAYVVYVPPSTTGSTTDNTIESCLRLGATHPDETTTYSDVCSSTDTFYALSSTYQGSNGIALLTPGSINMVAAGGVSTTCSSNTFSTAGPSYSVTAEPNDPNNPTPSNVSKIITASLTEKFGGEWITSGFTQAGSVSVTTNYQASFTAASSYSFAGGLSFSNGFTGSFSTGSGASVSVPLQILNVSVQWNSVSTQWPNGNGPQFQESGGCTANGFSFVVPEEGNANVKSFRRLRDMYLVIVGVANIATDLLVTAYAMAGGIMADEDGPGSVQHYLEAAMPISIACTALNGALCAMGLALGVMQLILFKEDSDQATALAITPGTLQLKTGEVNAAPALTLKNPKAPPIGPTPIGPVNSPRITLSIGDPGETAALEMHRAGLTVHGNKDKGTVTMNDSGLELKFGNDVSITLGDSGITLAAQGHSISVANDKVAITGQQVSIDALQTALSGLAAQLEASSKGLQEQIETKTKALQTQIDHIDDPQAFLHRKLKLRRTAMGFDDD